ncbi:Gfo/Idh/MocA family oxidoreductase [Rapidithrix thailandica]|uniref:Gfo/Idh/MocA family oxidoreductase n=1 Tax=Rapidithrix thailandica TaxID=413964 RepID=A0AAW9S6L4_9BACT
MKKLKKSTTNARRDFLKKSAIGGMGLAFSFSAKSYANILGANDRVNFAVIGINGRGQALTHAIADSKNTSLGYLCDVDTRAMEKGIQLFSERTGKKPKTEEDFRKLLEIKDVDAIAIATPDHLHAPMAIAGVAAGKHVYVEKPCCHNPQEGEWLVEAQKKHGKVVQMGNQQRSAPTSIQAMLDIQEGLIGEVYFGKAWYSNKRGTIGTGKKVATPEWLNWDLWQGPAPRRDFQDIWVHYNWHWFWHWGTGEINNNGTHEIDICRWALGVKYPTKVTSNGGRYHFDDDWEFYDTQVANFEFEGGKMITWEGKSCNPSKYHNRGRGATIHGTKGTILLDRNIYIAWDLDGNKLKEITENDASATTDTVGRGSLDVKHMSNFLDAIREGKQQNSPIDEGYKSNLLCHLGNISQKVGRNLLIDPNTGKILGDGEAMQMWGRTYEKGWEPRY